MRRFIPTPIRRRRVLRRREVKPDAAFFSKELGEFILPYDAVRTARDPDATLMEFLQSTYAAAADLAKWDRAALECALGRSGEGEGGVQVTNISHPLMHTILLGKKSLRLEAFNQNKELLARADWIRSQ